MFTKTNSPAKFESERSSILSDFKKALNSLINLNKKIDTRNVEIIKQESALAIEKDSNSKVRDNNIHSINTLRSIIEPKQSK